MASVSSPYGLQPISDQSGTPRTLRVPNGIASGYNTAIYTNQAVTLDPATGTMKAVTATTDKIFGIFMGVYYTPTGGRPGNSPFWPANGTYTTGLDDMFCYVIPAWIPGQRFAIQADGTVAQALLGSGFNISNFGNGSTVTGLSACTVAFAGVAAASQAQLALVEFAPGANNAIGDAFTDLIVSVAYPQIVSGFQTSIG